MAVIFDPLIFQGFCNVAVDVQDANASGSSPDGVTVIELALPTGEPIRGARCYARYKGAGGLNPVGCMYNVRRFWKPENRPSRRINYKIYGLYSRVCEGAADARPDLRVIAIGVPIVLTQDAEDADLPGC